MDEIKTPAEIDGKPSYDVDFIEGYRQGAADYAADPQNTHRGTGEKAYRKVSRVHGSWWVEGYCAAVDSARNAYAMPGVRRARRLGL